MMSNARESTVLFIALSAFGLRADLRLDKTMRPRSPREDRLCIKPQLLLDSVCSSSLLVRQGTQVASFPTIDRRRQPDDAFTMAAHSGLAGIASAFVFNPRLSNGRDSSTDGTLLAVLYPSELPRNRGLYRVAFLQPTNEDPKDLHS